MRFDARWEGGPIRPIAIDSASTDKEQGDMNTTLRKLGIFTASLGLVLGLSACQTLDPYTQESKTSNTAKGAAIGAAAGAIIGLISGDDAVERRQRALIDVALAVLVSALLRTVPFRQTNL